MNLFDYKPVVSVPREEIERKLKELKNTVIALENELERRDPEDKWQWGYNGITERFQGGFKLGYKYYRDRDEAVKAYVEETKEDLETAYYRIHKVYLDKETDK